MKTVFALSANWNQQKVYCVDSYTRLMKVELEDVEWFQNVFPPFNELLHFVCHISEVVASMNNFWNKQQGWCPFHHQRHQSSNYMVYIMIHDWRAQSVFAQNLRLSYVLLTTRSTQCVSFQSHKFFEFTTQATLSSMQNRSDINLRFAK